MQITILSVAAKPQQFFSKGKKKNPYHCPVSNIWILKSEREKYLRWSVWFLKPGWKIPPSKKPRGKSVPWRRRGVVAGMLSTLCGSMMCCLLGQRHPWDRGFLGGASWQEAAFFAGLLARGGGERTSWCHSVEWRGLLCSLSPCKVPCWWAFLQSRQGEVVRVSSGRLIAGGWARPELARSLTLGRQLGRDTSHKPTASASAGPPATKVIGTCSLWGHRKGRWKNSCDKKTANRYNISSFSGFHRAPTRAWLNNDTLQLCSTLHPLISVCFAELGCTPLCMAQAGKWSQVKEKHLHQDLTAPVMGWDEEHCTCWESPEAPHCMGWCAAPQGWSVTEKLGWHLETAPLSHNTHLPLTDLTL